MDALFQKTKTKPHLYFLPLSGIFYFFTFYLFIFFFFFFFFFSIDSILDFSSFYFIVAEADERDEQRQNGTLVPVRREMRAPSDDQGRTRISYGNRDRSRRRRRRR